MIMSLGTETTALHAAAILGKLGHLIVLLERGAGSTLEPSDAHDAFDPRIPHGA